MLRETSKLLMGIMALLFWLAAAGLIFVGSWVFMENRNYGQLVTAYYTLIPATILIAVGVILVILGLVGCIGAFKEHRCLLAVFFTVMLFILMGMVVAASLGYVYRGDIAKKVEDGIINGMDQYDNSTSLHDGIDFMQKELKCCGNHNSTDWKDSEWYRQHKNRTLPYPDSCCPSSNCTTTTPVYTRGCYTILRNEFLGHLGIIAGVAGGFAILLVFGMISACALMCRRRSTNSYIGLASPEHMRV